MQEQTKTAQAAPAKSFFKRLFSRKQRVDDGTRAHFGVFMIILCVLMALYVISLLAPMLWGIFNSLKTENNFRDDAVFLPSIKWGWAWSNYKVVFTSFKVPVELPSGKLIKIAMIEQVAYSLLYAVGCAFVSTLIPCITAYGVARFNYKFGKLIYTIVIVTMIIPIIGALPAEIRLMQTLRLYDTLWGVWLMRASFLGMYFLVFHATFKGISPAYSEAAQIDGASELRILVQVMFPLVRNIFLTVMLIKFIDFWNDYQTPMIYIKSYPTLAYGLYYFKNNAENALNTVPLRLAGCMIVLTPILILFLAFHKRLIGNISMGGVKE
jgi:ABC-type glycerol-3-phosphate transport system permease component